jgi:hypothetical protein
LEALKEDLGVRTSRSNFLFYINTIHSLFYLLIESNTYASVHKATSYDNEPLPPQVPVSTREDSLILTPHDGKRRSSYDINAPLPWEKSDNDFNKQPTITQRTTHELKQNTLYSNTQNPLNDDHLFSPSTTTTIKPKPRTSLQPKIEDHYQSDDIPNTLTTEHESSIPMNYNTTIRQPITDLHNVDWFTDSQPDKTTTAKTPLHHVEEEINHHELQSPSPQLHNHSELNAYDSDDFDENNNELDNTEQ